MKWFALAAVLLASSDGGKTVTVAIDGETILGDQVNGTTWVRLKDVAQVKHWITGVEGSTVICLSANSQFDADGAPIAPLSTEPLSPWHWVAKSGRSIRVRGAHCSDLGFSASVEILPHSWEGDGRLSVLHSSVTLYSVSGTVLGTFECSEVTFFGSGEFNLTAYTHELSEAPYYYSVRLNDVLQMRKKS